MKKQFGRFNRKGCNVKGIDHMKHFESIYKNLCKIELTSTKNLTGINRGEYKK